MRFDFHSIGQGGHQLPLNTTAKEVAKVLPLRLLHGGSYLGWVREFGWCAKPRGFTLITCSVM